MAMQSKFRPNLAHWRIPALDAGWIYAIRTGNLIKVGKTTDPQRRLLREAQTWSPDPLEVVGVKPFWNIGRIEYSLHSALAEFWHRGEWHKFDDKYWLDFFVDAFQQFRDDDDDRDGNSVNFTYWMNGTNYAEAVQMQVQHKMSLRKWQQCRGDPWRHLRPIVAPLGGSRSEAQQ